MLNGFHPDSDEKRRELYVAMTRAKQKLTIHLNGNYLDDITCQNLERINNDAQYKPSNLLVIQLSHKDIWLDFFIRRQKLITKLKSGDTLMVNNDGCFDEKGNFILKFSNRYKEIINNYQNKGYVLKESIINYIVYWKKEELEDEIKVVLPELKFIKADV